MRSENTHRPWNPDLPRIDEPVAGWYAVRMTRGGPLVAARLWYGPPLDPEPPHEPLDRSYRWQGLKAGQECSLEDLWPFCASSPITEATYEHMLAVQAWAENHAPDAPEANPRAAVDPLTCAIPW